MGASHAHHLPHLTVENTTLPATSLWRKVPVLGVLLGLAGLGGAWALGGSEDGHHHQFFFSYLTALVFWASIGLGALFFVLIQHGTRAGWSIVVRRIFENWMATLPLFALLIAPVVFVGTHDLYHWTHQEVVAGDILLSHKQPYLNEGNFIIRAFAVVAVWTFLATMYYRRSVAQDTTRDVALSHKMRWWAPLGFVLFAVSLTVAALDWVMSLDPHWYSTIFGIYYFAGGLMSAGAAVILAALALQKAGVLKDAITTEHYHDLGKWTFAFMVFWAYSAVSQFLLIWYANIPEETLFYGHRLHGGWEVVTVLLPIVKFFLPFWFLMSRHVKRNRKLLALGAGLLLVGQYVDMFWLVQPNMAIATGAEHGHFHFAASDALAFVGIGGLVVGLFAWLTGRSATAPVGDPRLAESLRFENM
jgi:hypothetical protein